MKKALLIVFLVATAAWAQHPLTFEDLAAIHRIGAPQVSPDGKWIAYDTSTPDLKANKGVSAVMLLPSGGGASRKIADGSSPAWSPDGKTLAYIKDDQVQLYVDGTSRKLTNLAGGVGALKWMPDSNGLLVVSDIYPDCGVDPACIKDKTTAAESKPTSARIITSLLYRHWKAWQSPTRTHILFVPLTGNARDLTSGAFDAPPFSIGGGDEFDVSPDGKELAFARDTSDHPELSTNSDVFIVPISGGDAKRITTRLGADTSPKYSPDGRWIAWRSQARAGYESDLWELWIYDRSNGTTRRLAPNFDNWIESIAWTRDSKSIYVVAPEKTKNAIYEIGVSEGVPRLVYNGMSADGVVPTTNAIYFQASTLSRPADIYKGTISGVTQLTHDNDTLLGSLKMGATSDYWYTGAENAQIQALIVRPPDFDATKKYPTLVLIHGGPQGNWADSWGYRWNPQMWAARGYVVFMPNPRGSTGYGQKFVEDISGDWGGKAYTDIMNGVDKLAAMPFVDSNRIGAAGGSFGGYMIDWILGHTDRFKALASHDGVYNLTSMYGVTEELWFPEWEFHGNPWDNPELYEKWSPHLYVKNFKTPTLVIHSELDFRVPIDQGLQLFTALQRRGVPSKLLYFPDEGHWVLKPRNSRLWYETVIGWFDQYLK
jgi:dipeptidyl aminopeptidase/acylaminoacyl peptidase